MKQTQRRIIRRDVDGILLLDKPAGLSSNAALQRARSLFCARKAGHTGNLDPLATGLLPLCFGRATKVSAFLLDADKHYEVELRFGIATRTGDAEGAVTQEVPVAPAQLAALAEVLPRFVGEISQIPPMYSALKHNGERLYRLARQGLEVVREPRQVRIHALELLWQQDARAALRVHCSKGTYVRTLVEDLATALGSCAHVTALRRTGAGPFTLTSAAAPALTLEALTEHAEAGEALDDLLLPADTALGSWPAIDLPEDSAYCVLRGNPVFVPHAPPPGWVRMYHASGQFLGMGEALDDGRVAPRRLMVGRGAR